MKSLSKYIKENLITESNVESELKRMYGANQSFGNVMNFDRTAYNPKDLLVQKYAIFRTDKDYDGDSGYYMGGEAWRGSKIVDNEGKVIQKGGKYNKPKFSFSDVRHEDDPNRLDGKHDSRIVLFDTVSDAQKEIDRIHQWWPDEQMEVVKFGEPKACKTVAKDAKELASRLASISTIGISEKEALTATLTLANLLKYYCWVHMQWTSPINSWSSIVGIDPQSEEAKEWFLEIASRMKKDSSGKIDNTKDFESL